MIISNGPRQHWMISVAAVIVAMMAIQMSSLGFSPLLPAIRNDLGASYSQMGLFTGMYGLIAIFISLPSHDLLVFRIGIALIVSLGRCRRIARRPADSTCVESRARVEQPVAI